MSRSSRSPTTTNGESPRPKAGEVAAVAVTGLLLLVAIVEATIVLPPALTSGLHVTWGMDFRLYLEHTANWLAGEGFYLPVQLAGPYVMEDVLGAAYPPVILYLLVPSALGLPWLLWWLVPLGIIGVAVARSRPSWWRLALLAAILCYPRTWTVIVLGNPAMWAFAALAAGMVWKWPAVGVLLKLTLAPFALVGARHRSFWVALAVAGMLAVPFGAMWLDYLTAMTNATSSRGLEYTLGEWPIAIALVLSLAGRGHRWGYRPSSTSSRWQSMATRTTRRLPSVRRSVPRRSS